MGLNWKIWRRRLAVWAMVLTALALIGALIWTWAFDDAQRQNKFLRTLVLVFVGYAEFLLWVLFISRWPARARWAVFGGTVGVGIFCALTLRISGVNGDLLPILEWRWSRRGVVTLGQGKASVANTLTNRYPQFLGPNRDGILPGPALTKDWRAAPPVELWRHAVGSAWSGFAIEGGRAVTQEQRGPDELVVCYDTLTGAPLWMHSDSSRYATTIAGEGPRATPTIDGGGCLPSAVPAS